MRLGPGERRRQIEETGDNQDTKTTTESTTEPAPSDASLVAFRLRHQAVPFSLDAVIPTADLHGVIEGIARTLDASATLSWIGPDDLFGVASVANQLEAEGFVRDLFDATSLPIAVNGTMVSLSPRIGALFSPTQNLDGAAVLDGATIALKGTTDQIPSRMHSSQMAEEAARKNSLETELVKAIDDSAITSSTQFAIDLQEDHRSDGFLSPRWTSATVGAVASSTLTALSRETSRSKQVAIQMLAHAFDAEDTDTAQLWLPIDGSDLIDEGFIDHLLDMRADHHLGVVLSQGPGLHLTPTTRALKRLRGSNVGVAIDGVGARGAIGLFDIASLVADVLMVDAVAIRMASYRPEARRALMTFVALAHSYEMRVCGLGIDNANLLTMVKEAGLDLALGTATEPRSGEHRPQK